jgi:hypothetical protein
MESDRARGFPARFCAAENSRLIPTSIEAVLWSSDKHLDKVIVERVVKLALKAPFELRVIEIAGVKIEIISVHRNGVVFELDNDFHPFPLGTRGEVQQGMFVEAQLCENAVKASGGGFGHKGIVKQITGRYFGDVYRANREIW